MLLLEYVHIILNYNNCYRSNKNVKKHVKITCVFLFCLSSTSPFDDRVQPIRRFLMVDSTVESFHIMLNCKKMNTK